MGTGEKGHRSSPTPPHTNDRKRDKLGHTRISVACAPCRQRKMRCTLKEGDLQKRCRNCIKRRKECVFRPVDQHDTMASGTQPSKIVAASVTSARDTYSLPEPTFWRLLCDADYRTESVSHISPNVNTGVSNSRCDPGFALPSDKVFGSSTFNPTVSDSGQDKLRAFDSQKTFAWSCAPCVHVDNLMSSAQVSRGLAVGRPHFDRTSDATATLGQCILPSPANDDMPPSMHYDMVTSYSVLTDTFGRRYPSDSQAELPNSTASVLRQQRPHGLDSQQESSLTKGHSVSITSGEGPEASCYLNSSLPIELDASLSIEQRRDGHDCRAGRSIGTGPRDQENTQAVYWPAWTMEPQWMRATSMRPFLQLGDTPQTSATIPQSLNRSNEHPCSATLQTDKMFGLSYLDFAFDIEPQPQLHPLLKPKTEICNLSVDDYQYSLRAVFTQLCAGNLKGTVDRLTQTLRYLQHNINELGLTEDLGPSYNDRVRLWDDFNRAWLTTLQHQHDLTKEMIRNDQLLHESDLIINAWSLEQLAGEIIRFCDNLEEHGLVDYQMGVAEEEIMELLIRCLRILERPDAEQDS